MFGVGQVFAKAEYKLKLPFFVFPVKLSTILHSSAIQRTGRDRLVGAGLHSIVSLSLDFFLSSFLNNIFRVRNIYRTVLVLRDGRGLEVVTRVFNPRVQQPEAGGSLRV